MSGLNLNIEIDWEIADKIIVASLKDTLESMYERPPYGIFYRDEDKDLKEMKKMRNALKLIINYYGVDTDES